MLPEEARTDISEKILDKQKKKVILKKNDWIDKAIFFF